MAGRKKSSFKISPSFAVLIFLLLLSGVSLSFSSGGFVVDFKEAAFSCLSAAERGVSAAFRAAKGVFASARDLRELKKRCAALEAELEDYHRTQRSNAEIRMENERLLSLLDFTESFEFKNHPAMIVARDIDKVYASITINKGSADGIERNMPVVASQDGNVALVGKVTEVGALASRVTPIYSADCSVSARAQKSRDLGLVTGNGAIARTLRMDYIKKRARESLSFGDVVVTSGENGNYMRDIPIGTITAISSVDYDSSLAITLAPILDFSRLESVTVVDRRAANDRARGEKTEGSK